MTPLQKSCLYVKSIEDNDYKNLLTIHAKSVEDNNY